ncbi:hypothetical protein F5Y10DRAFT_266231 [Nemania abortiva]|nr:hypothetical protein F5Y10DRAFT_266231 [Nemania abortiva]
MPDRRHSVAADHFAKRTSTASLQRIIEADVNGTFPSARYPVAAVDIHRLALPATSSSGGHSSGPYARGYQYTSPNHTASSIAALNQQGYKHLSYSMQRWLNQDRCEDPYHAFVEAGYRQQGFGVTVVEDPVEGAGDRECEEVEAPERSVHGDA